MIIYYSSSTSGSRRKDPEKVLDNSNLMMSFHSLNQGVQWNRFADICRQRGLNPKKPKKQK